MPDTVPSDFTFISKSLEVGIIFILLYRFGKGVGGAQIRLSTYPVPHSERTRLRLKTDFKALLLTTDLQ